MAIVKELMCRAPEFIPPETTLKDAALLMRENDIGFLPIGENDRLIGVLTDRDLVIRSIAEGWDPNTTSVREVMSAKVLYCFEDAEIKATIDNMGEQQVRRLIVLNKDKRMTGILSFHDIGCCQNDEWCGHLLEEVTEDRRAA